MPALVQPPLIYYTLAANQPQSLSGLVISDPMAAALAAEGQGNAETLALTLSVTEGALLLPDYNALTGITATGIGTGTIQLSMSANDIGALNSLLSSLEFVGSPVKGGQWLTIDFWNLNGSLMRAVTSAQPFLNVVGTPAATGTYALGTETIISGAGTLSGAAQTITGTLSGLAGLSAPTGVTIAPTGALATPYGTLSLSGVSYDEGTITSQGLDESGQLIAGGLVSLSGEMTIEANALFDFANGATVDTNQNGDFAVGLSLASGAVMEGNGTLSIGNFSVSGVIDGAGTIEALQGETLEIDAGAISAGVNLEVAGGGVMVLGPQPSLFGIFNATPLTIQSGVTLDFGPLGSDPISGGFANPLGGTGGAFVISGPQVFSGTVTNFNVGDALIFPSLTDLTVEDVNTIAGMSSFVVVGLESLGNSGSLVTESYTIDANIPVGLMPAASLDSEGDAEVVLHGGLSSITSAVTLAASNGVAQPLLGINLVLAGATTQSLTLTLAVEGGVLSIAGQQPASSLTLSAANIGVINHELASLSYTGTGLANVLTISSETGILGGLNTLINIEGTTALSVSGYGATAVTEAQLVSFAPQGGVYMDITPQALGEALIDGGAVDFENQLVAAGLSGTALQVDENGIAIWGAASAITMQGNVVVGAASSAGDLQVLSNDASVAGNMSLIGSGSVLDIMGTLSLSGTMGLAATAYEAGSLTAAAVTIGNTATYTVGQEGAAQISSLQNNGTFFLTGTAAAQVSNYTGTGSLAVGGDATLAVSGLAQLQSGQIEIYPDATLNVEGLVQTGGEIEITGTLASPTGQSVAGVTLSNAQLEGGWITATSLDVTGELFGYGSVGSSLAQVSGTLLAQGGALTVSSQLSGSGTLEIAEGATLALMNTVSFASAPQIEFAGSSAELILANGGQGLTSIANMSNFDGIDLLNIGTSLVSISGDVVKVASANESFIIGTSGSGLPGLDVVSDGNGGSLILFGNELPCFARGSGILTPQGYRPVEALRPGDPVINASGQRCLVRWVGWRTVDLAQRGQQDERPVVIRPHAFGPGKPFKPLKLSPLHCIYQDGVLVPVKHLVNGATIVQDKTASAMTYYHLELERHDIVLAEGLACETYFCNGNRDGLYHELGQRTPAQKLYAPHVVSGVRLHRIRQALHEQALAAGFIPGYIPRLRAVSAQGDHVARFIRGRHTQRAVFVFDKPVRDLTLICPTVAPAETDPNSQDRRALGLCLAESSALKLGAGWLPRAQGDVGTWMAARAQLSLPRARRQISLSIAAIPQSWFRQT